MFDRMNEYLKAVGINADIKEMMKDRDDNELVQYLFTTLNEMLSVEDRLNDQAESVKRDMERLQRKLTEPMSSVNSLGECQQSDKLNALCGEYEAKKHQLSMVAHMFKNQK